MTFQVAVLVGGRDTREGTRRPTTNYTYADGGDVARGGAAERIPADHGRAYDSSRHEDECVRRSLIKTAAARHHALGRLPRGLVHSPPRPERHGLGVGGSRHERPPRVQRSAAYTCAKAGSPKAEVEGGAAPVSSSAC